MVVDGTEFIAKKTQKMRNHYMYVSRETGMSAVIINL